MVTVGVWPSALVSLCLPVLCARPCSAAQACLVGATDGAASRTAMNPNSIVSNPHIPLPRASRCGTRRSTRHRAQLVDPMPYCQTLTSPSQGSPWRHLAAGAAAGAAPRTAKNPNSETSNAQLSFAGLPLARHLAAGAAAGAALRTAQNPNSETSNAQSSFAGLPVAPPGGGRGGGRRVAHGHCAAGGRCACRPWPAAWRRPASWAPSAQR